MRRVVKRAFQLLPLILPIMIFLAVGLALASSGGSHEPGTEVGGHGATPAQWWDLLYRAINFFVVAAVLFLLLRKTVPAMLRNRSKTIEDELSRLEGERDEAKKQLDETLARIKDAEKERAKIVDDFIAQGESEKARILAEADAAAARIKEQARMNIDQEIAAAKETLQQEVAEASAAKALELIKEKITPADQDRLVEEYLQKVVG